jgi:adenylate cyclase
MPESTRQLAAIMFTDIAGYTALMGTNEEGAFEVLLKNKEIHQAIITNFNGTLIKEMGDGMLLSFPLASEAVKCAVEIQKKCKEESIPLKIGIHEGEIVFAGEDVYGDGVNIASRLQEVVTEGCIAISEKVYSDIKNKAGINTKPIGIKKLKNVDDPVKVYEVFSEEATIESEQRAKGADYNKVHWRYIIFSGIFIITIAAYLSWYYFPDQPAIELDKSIAILPFGNASTEEENQYFVDGMMEDIRNKLSKIDDLRVISKTSAEKYKETNLLSSEIADELNVIFLLEGTVQKQGNQIKVHAQLIKAETDDHIWSETYVRDLSEVFKVQSEVAQAIAAELKAVISEDNKRQIEFVPTKSQAAYDSYLMGRYFWNQRTVEGLKKSVDYFEQALENDPEYSLAYAGLGDAYLIQVPYGLTDMNEGYPKAKKYALRALELNPNLAEAHATLGTLARREWRWQDAERELKRAIELNPNYSIAYHWYIEYLIAVRQPEEARKQMNRALEIDPLSFLLHRQNAELYYNEGKLDKALEENQKMQQLNPSRNQTSMLFKIYREQGRNQEALKMLHEYFSTSNIQMNIDRSEDIYAKEGIDGVIRWWLDIELKEFYRIPKPNAMYYLFFGEYYAMLGEKELALGWLEKGIKLRPVFGPYINSNRVYENLRSDPRFKGLLKEMGLDD